MEPILTLTGVCFGYGPKQVLTNISLEVNPGEIVGVLGPNGSGKSTLLQVMDGLLVPQAGEVRVLGTPIDALSRSAVARNVAMVAQESHFRFAFSVTEVVLMGRFPHLKPLQFEGHRDMDVAFAALEATQCLNLAKRSIHELSGGERQRVLIARALAQEPSVILLDEPTSFLDLKYKREIFKLIESLSKEKALGIVVVSHDIDLAARYCDHIVMLKEGAIQEAGAPGQVVTAASVGAVYDCPVEVETNPATGRPRVTVL